MRCTSTGAVLGQGCRHACCVQRQVSGVVSAANCGIRSCSADTGVDVLVVQVVAWVSCWKRFPTVQTVQKTGEIPQVLFLDTVVTPVIVQRQVLGLRQYRKLWISAVAVLSRWSMSLVVHFIDGMDVAVIMQRRWVSCWRCLKFSSSPEFVDLPVCTETGGLSLRVWRR